MRALAVLFALIAAPALAQEAPVATAPAQPAAVRPAAVSPAPPEPYVPAAIDPLGDLISQSGPQTTDEEEIAAPSSPPPNHKPTLLPIPAPESPAPTVAAGEHLVPQGTYVPAEQLYEMRVKGSIVAAQGLQGPLDGGWKVYGADGLPLYALQLVDPAGDSRPVEGAWRDIRRAGAVGSTGLIESVERAGESLVVRFSPRLDQTAVLTLSPAGTSRWSGNLYDGEANRTVLADREAPPSLPPGYVIQGRGPVIWGAPRATASRAAPAKAPACSTKGKTGKALKAAKAKCAAAAKKAGKGKAVAKGKKGSKAKATAARKGKATAGKKKSTARKAPNLR
ncbi:hypothetical protein [Caulobacter henricii]|uniref:Uncharacterized protein n=1 Tax=Caulobacter henricii TaxID=69395 RepID=A0A0P0P392_9CAUL|nr:hypothetical protein [Caulobacter henricii]ALL15012.1 hypothetical protein AQ619_17505 [Caulobacter henricii]